MRLVGNVEIELLFRLNFCVFVGRWGSYIKLLFDYVYVCIDDLLTIDGYRHLELD